ncbi:hypothetical protein L1887_52024 [Cichorium endivia]|nr:hypothetical protein L1887_52024 [Cichorium endivia]
MRAPVTTPRDSSDLLDVAPAEVESASPEPFALESNEPVDKTNRSLIKKLVHTLLVREHGLSKPTPTTSPPTTRRAQERGAPFATLPLPHTLQGRRRERRSHPSITVLVFKRRVKKTRIITP